jgi:hypothetical protein
MLSECTSGAANAAAAYVSPNGTDNWFLPTMGELRLMYTNLLELGLGGFQEVSYWSSVQMGGSGGNSSVAFSFFFYDGTLDRPSKEDALRVRAIRYF